VLHCVRVGYVNRFERTGDRLKMATRQMQINRRVGKLRVTEQHLDRAQISSGFQQMRGEAVAKGIVVLLMICISQKFVIPYIHTSELK
jgi:hypothetical protein